MSDEILSTTDQNLTNGMDETIINRILQREHIVVYSHNEFERFEEVAAESWQHDDTKRPTVEQVYKELNELDVDDVITEYEILMSILDNLTKDNIETNGDIADSSYVYNEDYGESSKSAQNGTKSNIEIADIDDTEDSILSSSDIKIDVPPEETFEEIDYYIKKLFQHYVDQFNMQHHSEHVALMVRKYMEKADKNPTKVFAQILQHPRFSYFTSLVGFFYRHGVVGKCFKNGYGTQKDILKMFHWLTKARDNGEQDAEDILQDIIDRMI
ncbi:9710_t:CDS:2 [Diversispora eburnea]|uniref:9710_t:CDS:1 n=1 Tax=Diversispora eburnea TaxID=1213867 RepID=A0A9N9AQI6_9GLOM|nr:9710_t:CDS:2 [Diversispora eburnea]